MGIGRRSSSSTKVLATAMHFNALESNLEVLLLLHFPLEHGTDGTLLLATRAHGQGLANLPSDEGKKNQGER